MEGPCLRALRARLGIPLYARNMPPMAGAGPIDGTPFKAENMRGGAKVEVWIARLGSSSGIPSMDETTQ